LHSALPLQETLVPRLAVESARITASGGTIDVVVIMCGLNDLKRASPWRTPTAFRHDLNQLIGEIHAR